eukprot:2707404-Amphidinium_carterae.1
MLVLTGNGRCCFCCASGRFPKMLSIYTLQGAFGDVVHFTALTAPNQARLQVYNLRLHQPQSPAS